MSTPNRTKIKGAALYYAQMGWAVFPLYECDGERRCACGKRRACKQAGKHPRTWNGFKAATTDEKMIRAWWTSFPRANIGIATGVASGLVVLDVDPKHDGSKTLRDLTQKHTPLPTTHKAISGSGGEHYYFSYDPETPVDSSQSPQGLEGLDVRADKGYIVAPPSNHHSGKYYRWTTPAHTEIAAAPSWLLQIMREPNPKPKRMSKKPGKLGKPGSNGRGMVEVKYGQRHVWFLRVAGALARVGAGEKMIYAALCGINEECCEPDEDGNLVPDDEIESIAQDIAGR